MGSRIYTETVYSCMECPAKWWCVHAEPDRFWEDDYYFSDNCPLEESE